MADEKVANVTVVTGFHGDGRPHTTMTFAGVDGVNVQDGHLLLKSNAFNRAVFAPGEWKTFYFNNAFVDFVEDRH